MHGGKAAEKPLFYPALVTYPGKTVPPRLKPDHGGQAFGTAEAVPFRLWRFALHTLRGASWGHGALQGTQVVDQIV